MLVSGEILADRARSLQNTLKLTSHSVYLLPTKL